MDSGAITQSITLDSLVDVILFFIFFIRKKRKMSCGEAQFDVPHGDVGELVIEIEEPRRTIHAHSTFADESQTRLIHEKKNSRRKFIEALPELFEKGKGDEYEWIRTLFQTMNKECDTFHYCDQPKTAELISLMFYSFFGIFENMVTSVTAENSRVFCGIYTELAESCKDLVIKKLHKGSEIPSVEIGPAPSAFDTTYGRKLFDRTLDVVDSSLHEFLDTGPGNEEWVSRPISERTLYDALMYHTHPMKAYYGYVCAMLAFMSNALRGRNLYLANIIVRFTYFSTKLVTRLVHVELVSDEKATLASASSSEKPSVSEQHNLRPLRYKMLAVLMQVGAMLANELLDPKNSYELFIGSERDLHAYRMTMNLQRTAELNAITEKARLDASSSSSSSSESGKGGCMLL